MKNRTVLALLVTALLIYTAAALISSAEELKQAVEMTEALRREIDAAESKNRTLKEKLGADDSEEAMLSAAEDFFGYTSSQKIIFIDKG